MVDLTNLFAQDTKRKTMAQMLAQQSIDTSPTPSFGAALARALQGGLAGVYEKQDTDEENKRFDKIYGPPGGDVSQPPAMAPQPPTARAPYNGKAMGAALNGDPPAAPPPAPSPTASNGGGGSIFGGLPGWAPGEKPMGWDAQATGAPPVRVASANPSDVPGAPPPNPQPSQRQPMAQAAPPADAQQRQAPQIPPDIHARARALWQSGDPQARAAAAAMLEPYLKPKDQVRPMTDQERAQWKVPEGVSAGIESTTGKPIYSQPANSVNVNTVANPVLEGVGKQLLDQRKVAQSATNTIPMLHEARRALDEGAITGVAADFKVTMQKVGALFGLPADQASNTEVFRTAVGNQVLGHIKELGANPSNADRDYIEKVMGGQTQLEEKSLRRVLDINEKYSRQAINNFNRDAKKLMDADPRPYQSIAPLMTFDQPPEYTAPAKKSDGGGWQVIDGVKIRKKQ